ncbi:MAG TPA: hypothetical protein V6C52_14215 [Coleofasciculaceae cyanobacterium]|jgi:hypothetical protein
MKHQLVLNIAIQSARTLGWAMAVAMLALILPYNAAPEAMAETGNKKAYYDIYLTEDRVCEACTGQWINNHQVALTNRQGERAIVESKEIIGVDNHPLVRKLFSKSLHETGLAAKVIVPDAFDDWEQFVCKYCKEFDPPR